MKIKIACLCFAIISLLVPAALSETVISGNIASNGTWPLAGSPYRVTGNTTILAGVTLSIQAGVTVKFEQNCGLWVDGALLATGTSAAPVTFTGTTGTAGWWRGIQIQNAGSATFQHAVVAYSGYWESVGILKTGTGALNVSDSTLSNVTGDGLRIAAGYSLFTSARNSFANNNYGVKVGIGASFNDNTSQFSGNNLNVFLDSGTITRNVTWNLNPAYSLYVSGNITVDAGKLLTILPGTVVKFAQNSGIWVDGQINASGTTGASIQFTDWRNDTVGGDANKDGVATVPAAGWWRGLQIQNAGSATLQYAVVAYSGYWESVGVLKSGSGGLNLGNTTLRDMTGDGLRVQDNTGAVTLANSTFSSNSQSGLRLITAGPVTAQGCSFHTNGYGVLQDINDTLNYENNTYTGNTQAGVGVNGGTRTSNMTLKPAGNPFRMLGNTTVAEGATLTMQPGVAVKFNQNCGLWVDGALQAVGTSTSSIVMTGSTEENGWWRGIQIQNAGSATLQHAVVAYSGYWESVGILKTGTGALSVSDSTLRNVTGDGLRIAAGYSAFTSARNTFANNNYGVKVGIGASFNDNTSQFSGNNINVYLDSGDITRNVTWNLNPAYSLYVSGNITVDAGKLLTILPGTVVKFAQNSGIWVDGQINASGTTSASIQFTDWRNDTVGGDSNKDGNATVPAAGWWRGLQIQNAGSATLQYAVVAYSGYWESVGVLKSGSGGLTLKNTTLRDMIGAGLRVQDNTGVVMLENSSFFSNSQSGLRLATAGPVTAQGCSFHTNGYGVLQDINDTFNYENNTFTGNAEAGVGVNGGMRASNMTLKPAGNPFRMLGNTTVAEGATLTIQPGVAVKFNQNCGLWVDGTLQAVGTSTSSIVITGSTESNGWWRGILIQNAGSATLRHAVVAYAGYWESAGILKTGTGALNVSDSTLRNVTGDGLRIAEGYSAFTSARNTFANNNYGVRVGNNASFNDNTSQFSGNNLNVFLDGGNITRNVTWNLNPAYSLYLSGSITVTAGKLLKILPGTVVKLAQNCGIWVDGQFNASGTAGASIQFTDWRNDTVGGDANKDSGDTAPAAGWWRGIQIRNTGSATLQYAVVGYSGYWDSVGVHKSGSGGLTLKKTTIRNTEGNGLVFNNSTGNHDIVQNTFVSNIVGIHALNQVKALVLSGNTIKGNRDFGVRNQNSTTVDARDNWWGSSSGPKHATLNPTGLGNAVSDGVLFKPWWTLANSPEIAVQQPAGTNLADGVSTVSLGSVKMNASLTKTFIIRNIGTASLTNLAVTKTGKNAADFTVTAPLKKTLASGASTTFAVTFKPSATGIRTAAIRIASNDRNENPFDIKLKGTGLAAALEAPALAGVGNLLSTRANPIAGTIQGLAGMEQQDRKAWKTLTTVERVDGRKYLTLVASKPPGGQRIKAIVEVSPNLVDWYSGRNHTTVMMNDPAILKVRDNTPVTPGVDRYIRLRLHRLP